MEDPEKADEVAAEAQSVEWDKKYSAMRRVAERLQARLGDKSITAATQSKELELLRRLVVEKEIQIMELREQSPARDREPVPANAEDEASFSQFITADVTGAACTLRSPQSTSISRLRVSRQATLAPRRAAPSLTAAVLRKSQSLRTPRSQSLGARTTGPANLARSGSRITPPAKATAAGPGQRPTGSVAITLNTSTSLLRRKGSLKGPGRATGVSKDGPLTAAAKRKSGDKVTAGSGAQAKSRQGSRGGLGAQAGGEHDSPFAQALTQAHAAYEETAHGPPQSPTTSVHPNPNATAASVAAARAASGGGGGPAGYRGQSGTWAPKIARRLKSFFTLGRKSGASEVRADHVRRGSSGGGTTPDARGAVLPAQRTLRAGASLRSGPTAGASLLHTVVPSARGGELSGAMEAGAWGSGLDEEALLGPLGRHLHKLHSLRQPTLSHKPGQRHTNDDGCGDDSGEVDEAGGLMYHDASHAAAPSTALATAYIPQVAPQMQRWRELYQLLFREELAEVKVDMRPHVVMPPHVPQQPRVSRKTAERSLPPSQRVSAHAAADTAAAHGAHGSGAAGQASRVLDSQTLLAVARAVVDGGAGQPEQQQPVLHHPDVFAQRHVQPAPAGPSPSKGLEHVLSQLKTIRQRTDGPSMPASLTASLQPPVRASLAAAAVAADHSTPYRSPVSQASPSWVSARSALPSDSMQREATPMSVHKPTPQGPHRPLAKPHTTDHSPHTPTRFHAAPTADDSAEAAGAHAGPRADSDGGRGHARGESSDGSSGLESAHSENEDQEGIDESCGSQSLSESDSQNSALLRARFESLVHSDSHVSAGAVGDSLVLYEATLSEHAALRAGDAVMALLAAADVSTDPSAAGSSRPTDESAPHCVTVTSSENGSVPQPQPRAQGSGPSTRAHTHTTSAHPTPPRVSSEPSVADSMGFTNATPGANASQRARAVAALGLEGLVVGGPRGTGESVVSTEAGAPRATDESQSSASTCPVALPAPPLDVAGARAALVGAALAGIADVSARTTNESEIDKQGSAALIEQGLSVLAGVMVPNGHEDAEAAASSAESESESDDSSSDGAASPAAPARMQLPTSLSDGSDSSSDSGSWTSNDSAAQEPAVTTSHAGTSSAHAQGEELVVQEAREDTPDVQLDGGDVAGAQLGHRTAGPASGGRRLSRSVPSLTVRSAEIHRPLSPVATLTTITPLMIGSPTAALPHVPAVRVRRSRQSQDGLTSSPVSPACSSYSTGASPRAKGLRVLDNAAWDMEASPSAGATGAGEEFKMTTGVPHGPPSVNRESDNHESDCDTDAESGLSHPGGYVLGGAMRSRDGLAGAARVGGQVAGASGVPVQWSDGLAATGALHESDDESDDSDESSSEPEEGTQSAQQLTAAGALAAATAASSRSAGDPAAEAAGSAETAADPVTAVTADAMAAFRSAAATVTSFFSLSAFAPTAAPTTQGSQVAGAGALAVSGGSSDPATAALQAMITVSNAAATQPTADAVAEPTMQARASVDAAGSEASCAKPAVRQSTDAATTAAAAAEPAALSAAASAAAGSERTTANSSLQVSPRPEQAASSPTAALPAAPAAAAATQPSTRGGSQAPSVAASLSAGDDSAAAASALLNPAVVGWAVLQAGLAGPDDIAGRTPGVTSSIVAMSEAAGAAAGCASHGSPDKAAPGYEPSSTPPLCGTPGAHDMTLMASPGPDFDAAAANDSTCLPDTLDSDAESDCDSVPQFLQLPVDLCDVKSEDLEGDELDEEAVSGEDDVSPKTATAQQTHLTPTPTAAHTQAPTHTTATPAVQADVTSPPQPSPAARGEPATLRSTAKHCTSQDGAVLAGQGGDVSVGGSDKDGNDGSESESGSGGQDKAGQGKRGQGKGESVVSSPESGVRLGSPRGSDARSVCGDTPLSRKNTATLALPIDATAAAPAAAPVGTPSTPKSTPAVSGPTTVPMHCEQGGVASHVGSPTPAANVGSPAGGARQGVVATAGSAVRVRGTQESSSASHRTTDDSGSSPRQKPVRGFALPSTLTSSNDDDDSTSDSQSESENDNSEGSGESEGAVTAPQAPAAETAAAARSPAAADAPGGARASQDSHTGRSRSRTESSAGAAGDVSGDSSSADSEQASPDQQRRPPRTASPAHATSNATHATQRAVVSSHENQGPASSPPQCSPHAAQQGDVGGVQRSRSAASEDTRSSNDGYSDSGSQMSEAAPDGGARIAPVEASLEALQAVEGAPEWSEVEGQCSSTADSRQRTTSGGGSVSTSQQHLRQGSRSAGRAQKRSADELDGEYADSATSRARRWRKNRVTASLPSQGALDAAQAEMVDVSAILAQETRYMAHHILNDLHLRGSLPPSPEHGEDGASSHREIHLESPTKHTQQPPTNESTTPDSPGNREASVSPAAATNPQTLFIPARHHQEAHQGIPVAGAGHAAFAAGAAHFAPGVRSDGSRDAPTHRSQQIAAAPQGLIAPGSSGQFSAEYFNASAAAGGAARPARAQRSKPWSRFLTRTRGHKATASSDAVPMAPEYEWGHDLGEGGDLQTAASADVPHSAPGNVTHSMGHVSRAVLDPQAHLWATKAGGMQAVPPMQFSALPAPRLPAPLPALNPVSSVFSASMAARSSGAVTGQAGPGAVASVFSASLAPSSSGALAGHAGLGGLPSVFSAAAAAAAAERFMGVSRTAPPPDAAALPGSPVAGRAPVAANQVATPLGPLGAARARSSLPAIAPMIDIRPRPAAAATPAVHPWQLPATGSGPVFTAPDSVIQTVFSLPSAPANPAPPAQHNQQQDPVGTGPMGVGVGLGMLGVGEAGQGLAEAMALLERPSAASSINSSTDAEGHAKGSRDRTGSADGWATANSEEDYE